MGRFDLAPLYRQSIGFDHLASLMEQLAANDGENGFPPYNIERLDENEYRITMAVAGFSSEDLNIEVKEGTLSVRGEKTSESKDREYPASRHRRPQLRTPVPSRGSRRGQRRDAGERVPECRSETGNTRGHEASHHQDRQGGPERPHYRRREAEGFGFRLTFKNPPYSAELSPASPPGGGALFFGAGPRGYFRARMATNSTCAENTNWSIGTTRSSR